MPDKADDAIDVAGLEAAWNALEDTHDFHRLLAEFHVGRVQALRLVNDSLACRVDSSSLNEVLHIAAQDQIAIMVFVASPGVIQIHSGPIHNVKSTGPWLNVLDDDFNLHVREDHLDSAWVVQNRPATAQSSVWNYSTARAKPLPCSLPGASKAKRQWTLGTPRWPHSREYNTMKWIPCLGLITALLVTTGDAEEMANDSSRIVTLGGTITEIVFALGVGERVVGVDASSSFPEAVNQLPKAAYHRRLSAEGVLSLRPTLIIATTEAGPPEAIQQLKSAGVTVLVLPHEPTVENAIAKIERIAAALNVQARGTALIQALKRS